jgi:hypothetical protein
MCIRRLQYGLGSLLILTTACAFASQWLRKPVIRAAIEAVGVVANIEAIGVVSEHRSMPTARFRIINAGPDRLWYTGYDHNFPLYSWEVERNGIWENASGGWCGTGASSQTLKAGEEMVFDISIPERATAIKAGLWVSTSDPAEMNPASATAGNQIELWSKPLTIPSADGAMQPPVVPTTRPRPQSVLVGIGATLARPIIGLDFDFQ